MPSSTPSQRTYWLTTPFLRTPRRWTQSPRTHRSSNGDGTGCPLNDPATDGGLGPKNTSPKNEYGGDKSPSVGFGKPLGLNSGNKGSSIDYMWILVR